MVTRDKFQIPLDAIFCGAIPHEELWKLRCVVSIIIVFVVTIFVVIVIAIVTTFVSFFVVWNDHLRHILIFSIRPYVSIFFSH